MASPPARPRFELNGARPPRSPRSHFSDDEDDHRPSIPSPPHSPTYRRDPGDLSDDSIEYMKPFPIRPRTSQRTQHPAVQATDASTGPEPQPRPSSVTTAVNPLESEGGREDPDHFELAHTRSRTFDRGLHNVPSKVVKGALNKMGLKGGGGGDDGGEGGGKDGMDVEAGVGMKEPYLCATRRPLSWKHLFKRPVVRQWIHEGKLYREEGEREPSRFELFFDLAFVGIVHQLADGIAQHDPTALSIVKFCITFFPSWSVWQDVRNFINVSGTDDVPQRLYILLNMLLLVGYSSNASAIEIVPTIKDDGSLHFKLESNFHPALKAAVLFFLVAKMTRVLIYLYYGWYLARFRTAQWSQAIATLVPAIFFFPLCFVQDSTAAFAMAALAVLWELASKYLAGALTIHFHKRGRGLGGSLHVPAINIGHLIERLAAFVILVMGETIMNSTYDAIKHGQTGLSNQFGRATMAVCIAFALIWLYFDADASRVFTHALRRNWLTNVTWSHLHWPLCASYVLLSAAVHQMIEDESVEKGFRWFFSGAITICLLCMTAIGFLHRNLDAPRSALLPRSARLGARLLVAVIFLLLPLIPEMPSLSILASHAGILTILVIFETVTKIGAVPAAWADEEAYEDEDDEDKVSEKKVDLESGRTGLAGGAPLHSYKTSGSELSRLGKYEHKKSDLTAAEIGEEDVGVDGAIGNLHIKEITLSERLAYMG